MVTFVLYLLQHSYQEPYISYKRSSSALSVLLYFMHTEVLTEYTSLELNTLSMHLLNKQTVFFDKNVSILLLFYNYPATVLYLATSLTHYDSYRTAVPFNPPMQNTINVHN